MPPEATTGRSVRGADVAQQLEVGALEHAVLVDVGDDVARAALVVETVEHLVEVAAVPGPAPRGERLPAHVEADRDPVAVRGDDAARTTPASRARRCRCSPGGIRPPSRPRASRRRGCRRSSPRRCRGCRRSSRAGRGCRPRPKAASRSTRWIHSAPASCQRSAASTGSPKRFSEPATPWTSWTAWPSAMSTAGSSSRWSFTGPPGCLRAGSSASEQHRVQDRGGEQADDQHHRAGGPVREDHPDQHVQRTSSIAMIASLPASAPRPGPRSVAASADAAAASVTARRRARADAPAARPRRPGRRRRSPPPARAPRDAARAPCSSPVVSPLHPVAQQPGAGVAGLLRVELGRAQRAVLDRGDEPVAAVARPRSPAAAGCGRWSTSFQSRTP